jgi:hypothetical protein
MKNRGIALAMALWLITVAGAFLTMAVVITRLEVEAADNARRLPRTRALAEVALAQALTSWTPRLLALRLPTTFDTVPIRGTADGVEWRGTVRRLNERLFLFEVTARQAPPRETAVRQGWLVGVQTLSLDVFAALSVRDTVRLGDGVVLSGQSATPEPTPGCADGDTAVAGVSSEGPIEVGSGAVVSGQPGVVRAPPTGGEALTAGQEDAYQLLAREATLTLPPGVWRPNPYIVGGRCVSEGGPPDNWGDGLDPLGACGSYWPVVHVRGNLTLSAGQGHGILLVDGDLAIDGELQFRGVVMVRGRVETRQLGLAAHIWGGLIAARATGSAGPVTGLEVRYSKCLINKALTATGRLAPIAARSWRMLY